MLENDVNKLNTYKHWLTNIRCWSSWTELFLYNNHMLDIWYLQPCSFSLDVFQALSCNPYH